MYLWIAVWVYLHQAIPAAVSGRDGHQGGHKSDRQQRTGVRLRGQSAEEDGRQPSPNVDL